MTTKRKYYLAYGANTNFKAMNERCPRAVYVGNVMLPEMKLVFRGCADVVEAKESKTNVHLALWTITKSDEDALDRFEGFPHFYTKRYFEVNDDGEKVQAMIYVMRSPMQYQSLPSDWYEKCLREGYVDCGLPVAQIDAAIAQVHSRAERVPHKVLPKGVKPTFQNRSAREAAAVVAGHSDTPRKRSSAPLRVVPKTKLQKLAAAAEKMTAEKTPAVKVNNSMQAALARALGLEAVYD